MRVYIASDHGGFDLKEKAKKSLGKGFEAIDLGTTSRESTDFPDYAQRVALAVAHDPKALGVLVCGTGIGMCIAANKVHGAYAALAYNEASAKLAREHNEANILCLGGRTMNHRLAVRMLKLFLKTKPLRKERYERRNNKIKKLEVRK